MCKFFYTECECPDQKHPCRLYNRTREVKYCKLFLGAYPWWADRPPEPACLMVEESDEYGNLAYRDNGINFRTKPKVPDETFQKLGCHRPLFQLEDVPSVPCPYHGPGGLKEKWDTIGKDKYDIQRLEKEKTMPASILEYQKQEKKRKKADDKLRRELRKKQHGENGCTVL